MKNIIRIGAILLIIHFVRDYMLEHNLTLIEMFTTFPEKENTPQINQTNNQIPIKEKTKQYQPKDIIHIKALGNVEYNDLTDAKNIIEETYQFNCIISGEEPITEDLYISGTRDIINAESCLKKFSSQNRVVYIVDKRLWASGDYLRGFATTGGGFVIVRGEKSFLRETLIHEIGHNLGIEHCSDLTCIMAVKNDRYDTGDFCQNCKKQIQTYLNK